MDDGTVDGLRRYVCSHRQKQVQTAGSYSKGNPYGGGSVTCIGRHQWRQRKKWQWTRIEWDEHELNQEPSYCSDIISMKDDKEYTYSSLGLLFSFYGNLFSLLLGILTS